MANGQVAWSSRRQSRPCHARARERGLAAASRAAVSNRASGLQPAGLAQARPPPPAARGLAERPRGRRQHRENRHHALALTAALDPAANVPPADAARPAAIPEGNANAVEVERRNETHKKGVKPYQQAPMG